MRPWTMDAMRNMKLPTTAWVRNNTKPEAEAEPVILISATARRSTSEHVVVCVTTHGHSMIQAKAVEEGIFQFFPDDPNREEAATNGETEADRTGENGDR